MSRRDRFRALDRRKEEPVMSPFECVDPVVGDRVWELQHAELDPSVRSLLEAHVAACDACRHVLALDGKVETLVRTGRIGASVRALPRVPRWTRAATALAAAASFVLLFALPPHPLSQPSTRGAEAPRFTRPVEGEVIATSHPIFRWTPIERAKGYVVELRDGDGRSVWTGTSGVPEIRVGEGVLLAPGREYRALLSVRPADLSPPGAVSVEFRRDSAGRMLAQRAWRADRWRQILAALSVMLVVGAWVGSSASKNPSLLPRTP